MLALVLGGCSGAATDDELRKAWLVEALADDNRVWLSRDPALLGAKYAKMAADPYDYLRGTAGVTFRDRARAGSDRSHTIFLRDAEAVEVLLTGDPHPENMGTFRPADLVVLELNDFDGSAFGPYLLDVQRLALGLIYLADEAGFEPQDAALVVDAAARGYLEAVVGDPWPSGLVPGQQGVILDQLLSKVSDDGAARARLLEYTEVLPEGGRRFRFDAALEAGAGVLPLTIDEGRQLDRLLASWSAAPEGFRVLDRGRRFGSGVASLPSVRYVVAYDLGDDGPDDDALVSIREVVDPPAVPGVHVGAPGYWDSGADRIEATARTLWSRADADPRYAGLTDGAMTFKVQTWASWHDSFDHERVLSDIARGRVVLDELVRWAGTLGQLLGSAHARAPTARGGEARAAILRDLNSQGEVFVTEIIGTARADLDQLRTDHRLFVEAREELGDLLGMGLVEGR